MEINVNTVYTTVLSILNKEQRGYITPYEFNNLATQVQLDIFESYFENLNQQLRSGGNSSDYADRVKLLEEKIARFQVDEAIVLTDVQGLSLGNLTSLTEPVYRLGALYSTYENYLAVEAEEVTSNQFNKLRRSNLTSPSRDWPVYYKQGNQIKLLPNNPTASNQTYQLEYIRKPKNVVWAYGIGTQGQYIWDEVYTGGSAITPASGSQNFEIDVTDQTEVILKILMYAGVIIKDPEIIQAASGQAQMKDQLQSS